MASSLEILRPGFSTSNVKPVIKERCRKIEQHLAELSYQSLKLISDQDWTDPFFVKYYASDKVAEHSFGPRVTMNSGQNGWQGSRSSLNSIRRQSMRWSLPWHT